MKPSTLTTIGAAAALALALGFAGAPAMAQGAPDMPAPDAGPAPGAQRQDPAAAGEARKAGTAAEMEKGNRKTGAEVEGRTRTGAEADVDREKTGTAETDMKEVDRDKAGTAETDMKKGDRDKTGTAEAEKSGEGKAAVKIEPEQKTKITSYFKENKPNVKVIDKSSVSVSIGIAVPASIRLHPLPADIIVVAGDCSLLFFLWGPDLVLVDSCTRHVVDVIPGIA